MFKDCNVNHLFVILLYLMLKIVNALCLLVCLELMTTAGASEVFKPPGLSAITYSEKANEASVVFVPMVIIIYSRGYIR